MPRVLQDVVGGEKGGPPLVGGGLGQCGLLQDEGRPSIPSHAVQHPEERAEGEREGSRHQGDGQGARSPQHRQADQEASPAQAVSAERGEEAGQRGPREAGRNHQPKRGGNDAQPGEVEPEQDGHEPRRRRAKEGGEAEPALVRGPEAHVSLYNS